MIGTINSLVNKVVGTVTPYVVGPKSVRKTVRSKKAVKKCKKAKKCKRSCRKCR